MIFGLTGLLMSPSLHTSTPSLSKTDRGVSLAIAAGPHLQLMSSTGSFQPTANQNMTTAMICRSVINLAIADVGLGCHQPAHRAALSPTRL